MTEKLSSKYEPGSCARFLPCKREFLLTGVACSGDKFMVSAKHRKQSRCIFPICCAMFPPHLWSSLLPISLHFFKHVHLRTPLPVWNRYPLCRLRKSTPHLAAMRCLSPVFELWNKTSTTSLAAELGCSSYCCTSVLQRPCLFPSIARSSVCKLATINSH